MRRRMLVSLLLLLSSLLLLPKSVSAAPAWPVSWDAASNPWREPVTAAGNGGVIFSGIHFKRNVTGEKSTRLPVGQGETVLDTDIIPKPGKVVLLTRTPQNKLMKYTFDQASGRQIGRVFINIPVGEGGTARWTPAYAGSLERVWVHKGMAFSAYAYPYARPQLTYNASSKALQSAYEYVNVLKWQVSSSGFLGMVLEGSVIMGEQRWIQGVNTNNGESKMLEIEGNPDLDIDLVGGSALAVTSRWQYPELFPANVTHPDSRRSQPVYTLLDIATGNVLTQLKASFEESVQGVSGWEAQLFGKEVYVRNLLTNRWSLYSLSGVPVLTNQPGPQGNPEAETAYRYAGWSQEEQEARFLAVTASPRQAYMVTVPLQMK